MEQNYCIVCGMGIPEGRMVCPLCEAKYECQSEKLEKVLEKMRQVVSAEEAVEAIRAAFKELINQRENTFCDCWEQLQEWIFTIKEKIPETPYFFKKKTLIRDKRPHKQHRIRNNCRKERKHNGN